MEMIRFATLVLLGLLLSAAPVRSQVLVDGFFRGAGNADVSVSYTYEHIDEFYLGAEKMPVPLIYEEITRNSLNLFVAYGLTDDIDLNLNLPYVFSSGNGQGPPAELPPQELSSFQDGALAVKWRPYQTALGNGRLDAVVGLGGSVPLADYENGLSPTQFGPVLIAIGDRAPILTGNLLLQYRLNAGPLAGLFGTVLAAYSLKGKTGDVDVPNATNLLAKVGFGTAHFYGDVWILRQISADGPDIGEAPFPAVSENFTQIGLTGSVAIVPELALSVRAATVVDGRNVGALPTILSAGLTYKFSLY